MSYLNIFVDLLILLFWVRWLPLYREEFHFNPFLAMTVRWADRVVDFFRPAFPFLSQGSLAGLLGLLLLVLRGAAWRYFQVEPSFSAGELIRFSALPRDGTHFVLYSVLTFIYFMLCFSSMLLFLRLIVARDSERQRVYRMLMYAGRPLSEYHIAFHFAVVLVLSSGLFYFFLATGCSQILPVPDPVIKVTLTMRPLAEFALTPLQQAGVSVIGGLLFMLNGLICLLTLLIVAFFTSLLSLITGSRVSFVFAQELMRSLMGRFDRAAANLLGGTLDLTPVFFYFAIPFIQGTAVQLLVTLLYKWIS